MPETKRDEDEIGAAWIQVGRKGEYLTGNLHGERFIAFRNDRKAAGSKAPDYRFYRPKASGPKPERAEPDPPPTDWREPHTGPIDDDDPTIPF
jgi:hypothetical protein